MGKPAVAVLAAGLSTRFGGEKLEASCAGKPLGRWVIEAVEGAGLGPGTIVTGPGGASFAEGWATLVNGDPAQGLGTSLALAARHARDCNAPALLVLLADMPLVTPEYLRALAAMPAPVATRYPDGHAGVPVLLDRKLIHDAALLTGARGAGPLLRRARLLDPPPGMLRDVDTPEDLAEVAQILSCQPTFRHPRESGDPVGSAEKTATGFPLSRE